MSSLQLKDGDDEACVVDWTGDGDLQVIGTASETTSSVVPSIVTIYSKTRTLTFFTSSNNIFNFNLKILPSTLTYFLCTGSNTISGDLAGLPSTLTNFNCAGSNTVSAYTSGHTFNSGMSYFLLLPAFGYGLDSTEVNNLLIDLDASGMSSGTIDISGNNAARTSASDTAVASLESVYAGHPGVLVTVNE